MTKSTKQLARELGFLRKRPLPETPNRLSKKRLLSGQIFSHLIIIDFESTCWENDKHSPQEIIEFPAILMNTKTGEIESEFHYYLQPTEMPFLSNFCQQLTGITQIQVDNGIPLNLCLRKFTSWLNGLHKDKGIVCANDNITNTVDDRKMAAFVTWSDWDLGVCLHYEIKRKQIMRPPVLDRWIDLRATYRNFYSRKPDGLNGALKDVGIGFDGREHSGLDDARNTARLAWRMICDGCIMTLTKTLKMNLMSKVESPSLQTLSLHSSKTKVASNQKVTNAPFEIARDVGDETSEQRSSCYNAKIKLSERNLNVMPMHVDEVKKADSSPSNYNSNLNQQTDITLSETLTADHSPSLKMGSNSLKLPTTPVSRIPLPLNSSSSVKLRSLTFHNGVCNAADSKVPPLSGLNSASKSPAVSLPPTNLSSNTSDSSCCLPVPLNASRSGVTKTSTGMLQITRNNFTSFSSNSNKSHSSTTSESSAPSFTALKAIGHQPSAPPQVSGVKTLGLKASSSVNKFLPAPVHTSFKTPTSLDKNNSSLLNKSNGVNSSFKTPISRNMNVSLNMKATPPLCSCGRRSKRRLVQNQGPNTGRWFFTCSVASSSVSADKKTGCKFFQWESPVLPYS